ncbi:uncharacterized protein RSE6_01513 [Rhynchosporium secalis]|uniref:Uncharacterized protein n=1 Tax=Rhynchosporium secalis TaxID=38038 RepID=A0A1E1LY17_RHYSE|nr:uncharacterized protein RSE6_01513 [Rhynchosporium secalis]
MAPIVYGVVLGASLAFCLKVSRCYSLDEKQMISEIARGDKDIPVMRLSGHPSMLQLAEFLSKSSCQAPISEVSKFYRLEPSGGTVPLSLILTNSQPPAYEEDD